MQHLRTAVLMVVVLTVLLGIVYPLLMTGISQVLFPAQANGSLVRDSAGNVIGSAMLGQNFTDREYFHPRPSAAGRTATTQPPRAARTWPDEPEADRRRHGSRSRLPRGEWTGRGCAGASRCGNHLRQRARSRHQSRQRAASGSAGWLKRAGVYRDQVRALVNQYTEGRTLGILGEPRVNVLKLNLALDGR